MRGKLILEGLIGFLPLTLMMLFWVVNEVSFWQFISLFAGIFWLILWAEKG